MKPKRFAQTSESILARIANRTYIELGVNATTLKGLIYRFVNSLNLGTDTKLYYTKINLFNELTRNVMTFKVFMKAMTVLNASKVTFRVTVLTKAGKEVTVEEVVYMNAISHPEDGGGDPPEEEK